MDEVGHSEEVESDPKHGGQDAAFGALLAELTGRCRSAKIQFEVTEVQIEVDLRTEWVTVFMPAGRDTRPIVLYDSDDISRFLSIHFEKYVLMGEYGAFVSYEDGVIEATIGFLTPFGARSLFRKLGISSWETSTGQASFSSLTLASQIGSLKVAIGPSSAELALLSGFGGGHMRPGLRIEGVAVSQLDEAIAVLERLANSLFFQLDLTHGVPLTLARRRRRQAAPQRATLRAPKKLEFPKHEYGREPLALYWYGRSASGMPLLQFLAYYQTIEFHFPTYSQAEARRKIRNLLKNPSFRVDNDTDVAKILMSAKSNGAGYGDERTQLRATITECLDAAALRAFLTANAERVAFFSKKAAGLTDKHLALKDKTADLRNDVADRLYDIRCRVVHTKSGGQDGDMDLLLPFSKEADALSEDILLCQFIAREVLVSASSSLSI